MEVIIEYGLYFLVFVLPWQARWIIRGGEINNGYSEYSTISLYGTDVLLIIVLALFAVYKIINFSRKSGERLKIQPVWLLVAGLELMVFISIFASADKLMAIYAYGRFLLGVGLFWLIMSASYNRIKLIYAFLGGVFLQTCLGVWQFLIQSSRACKWLGLSVHNPADAGVSVVETLSGERWLRAYGGLDHPNMLGGLLAISLLLALYIFLFKIHHKQYNSKFLINAKYLILNIVVLFFLVGLFFTFSRGAWVGLIAGILSILIIALIKRDLLAQKKILKIILAGGILVFILFNLYGDLVMTRLAKDARLELKSNAERIESFAG
ncbi:MAG: O-antigen ligase family protein, partial [Patescibacteria group bacterium]|nr:O-antigen ligase family protein [Patescibacteria group bacterium]